MGNMERQLIPESKIKEITETIVNVIDPDKILLIGSYAAGNPNVDSDIDLIVIKDSILPRYKRGIEIDYALKGIGVPADIIVYTHNELIAEKEIPCSFIQTAVKTSKLLYEKQS